MKARKSRKTNVKEKRNKSKRKEAIILANTATTLTADKSMPSPSVGNSNNGFVKIPWISRIGYGMADTSCNIVYGMINTLLTLFYTDYAGIPFATVGLVM